MLVIKQFFNQGFGKSLPDSDFNGRINFLEMVDQICQKECQPARNAYGEIIEMIIFQEIFRQHGLVEQLLRISKQLFTGLCKMDPLLFQNDQFCAKLCFQSTNMLGDRRLSNRQPFGSPAEALFLRQAIKRNYMMQVELKTSHLPHQALSIVNLVKKADFLHI
ncbi:MAG: hypothetical protein P8X68_07345 [Desulfobacterales bacterium]